MQGESEVKEPTRAPLTAGTLVVKVGTQVVSRPEGGIDQATIESLVEDLARLHKEGRRVILVSSGAIGLGAHRLALPDEQPHSLPLKQACAAAGQASLMRLYDRAFERHGVITAQLLLTEWDFSGRIRYLNLRNTFHKLLDLGVLPIVNENDTVSTLEIEETEDSARDRANFGDNDKLSALVMSKLDAELLIILTDVEGLLEPVQSDPQTWQRIPIIQDVDSRIHGLVAGKENSGLTGGRGGMRTKLQAAAIATRSGGICVIANGKGRGVLGEILSGADTGTLFLPRKRLSGRKRWIAFAASPRGQVTVNTGARNAIVDSRASLLMAGVTGLHGEFRRGDAIEVQDDEGRTFARGISNYSSSEAVKLIGLVSEAIAKILPDQNYEELITRDNLVLIDEG